MALMLCELNDQSRSLTRPAYAAFGTPADQLKHVLRAE